MAQRQQGNSDAAYVIQQGDVLLFSGARIPKGATPVGHMRLAEGEVTGHCHEAVGEGVELVEHDGTLYLSAPQGATVTHQEHQPVTLGPGTYRVGRVREYDHFAEEARAVQD